MRKKLAITTLALESLDLTSRTGGDPAHRVLWASPPRLSRPLPVAVRDVALGFQTLARADRIHARELGTFQASSGLRTGPSMTLPCPGQKRGRYGGTQSGRVSNTTTHSR